MVLDHNRTAFVFPGQGSQSVGMGAALVKSFPVARQVFEEADAVLGFPLSRITWEGSESELNDTINTQPALLVHSMAVLFVLREWRPEFRPAFVAGHSMGEFSALVAAGSLSYPDALRLVRHRGELMKEAGEKSPGGMAAVLGLDLQTVEKICEESSQKEDVVQVANDNCPGQVVISGASTALKRAISLAQEAGARRIRKLAVSIAAHSPLMQGIQTRFLEAIENSNLLDPRIPIIGNVSALPLNTAREIQADLQAQLTSPVRWTESVQEMVSRGIRTFIELGNGTVLSSLIKRINPEVEGISIGNPDEFNKYLPW